MISMKTISKIFSLLFILMSLGCDDDALMPSSVDGQDAISNSKNQNKDDAFKATGDVEVTFISNPGGGEHGNQHISKEGTQKFAHVVFNAHEGDLKKEAKGNIEITMKNKEGLVKRKFVATIRNAVWNFIKMCITITFIKLPIMVHVITA